MPGGDSAVAGETLGELYDKLMGLQSDMENLAETAGKLVEDKEDKQRLLEVWYFNRQCFQDNSFHLRC